MRKHTKVKFNSGIGRYDGRAFMEALKKENAYTKIRVDDLHPNNAYCTRNACLKKTYSNLVVVDNPNKRPVWYLGIVYVKSLEPFVISCDGRSFVLYY